MSLLPTRRHVVLTAGAAAVAGAMPAQEQNSAITLGAIRWDPWYEPSDVGERAVIEHVLDVPEWRPRAPSCATVAEGRMDFGPCSTQARIDMEIQIARKAGIRYWAYNWYGIDHPMQAAWRLHRSSYARTSLNWCMVLSTSRLVSGKAGSIEELVALLNQDNYQRVLSRRPLLFLLRDEKTNDVLRDRVGELRAASRSAGIGDPYIVLLYWAVPGLVKATGVDAIGVYAKGSKASSRVRYSDWVSSVEAFWDRIKATDQAMIPTAVTGADRRPRIERPVPWEADHQKPFDGINNYYEAGTPIAIAAHIHNMVHWIASNQEACPAQTGLIYSWNEHDEGGSTLSPSIGDRNGISDAMSKIAD